MSGKESQISSLHQNPSAIDKDNVVVSDTEVLSEAIVKLLDDRAKLVGVLLPFSKKEKTTRMILAGIQNKVSLYTKLKDSDSRLEHVC